MGMTLAHGTAINSQLPPSTALPRTVNSRQWFCSPARHFDAVSAEVHGRDQHALPDCESGDVLADFGDLTGDVAAEDVRQFHARQSFANPDVEVVERAGLDAHQHLIFARLRVGDVFVGQNFGTTELMNADGFHGAFSSCCSDADF